MDRRQILSNGRLSLVPFAEYVDVIYILGVDRHHCIRVVRIPSVNRDLKSPTAVWSPIMLNFLTVEFVLIAMIFGLTFYLQSRKRDFI